MKRSISLFSGLLLTAFPVAGLLTGCSGGFNGGIGTPTATPTGTAIVPISFGTAPVSFGNGQTGTLALTRTGNTISGTLVVNAAPVLQGKKTNAFTFGIAAGTYSITGTVDPFATPITFNVTGNFPAPVNAFSISGTLPTTTTTGNYTITAAGQTVTGTYPIIGGTVPTSVPTPVTSSTPSPTSTATPTATVPPIGIGGSFDLTLTQTANSNFGLNTYQPTAISGQRTASGQISVGANVNKPAVADSKTFILIITPGTALKAGDKLTLGTLGLSRASITVGGFAGGEVTSWTTSGGTLTITAISSTSISGTLTGATLVPGIGSAATGTLTFNGSFQANLGGSP